MKRKRVLLLLCILSCTLQLFAQQINVQGVVYDPSGETVPGANVSMKSNPAVGTVPAINGNIIKIVLYIFELQQYTKQ